MGSDRATGPAHSWSAFPGADGQVAGDTRELLAVTCASCGDFNVAHRTCHGCELAFPDIKKSIQGKPGFRTADGLCGVLGALSQRQDPIVGAEIEIAVADLDASDVVPLASETSSAGQIWWRQHRPASRHPVEGDRGAGGAGRLAQASRRGGCGKSKVHPPAQRNPPRFQGRHRRRPRKARRMGPARRSDRLERFRRRRVRTASVADELQPPGHDRDARGGEEGGYEVEGEKE